jgi:hypothetical protein
MAATATLKELNGVTPTVNTPAGTPQATRFCTADDYDPGTDHPVPILESGTNYSYWKTWRLDFTGTFTEITNIQLYVEETFDQGTGVSTVIGENTGVTYVEATGTQDEAGTILNNTNYTGIGAAEDISTYVAATPKTIDTSSISTEGPSNTWVCQLVVADTATQGAVGAETVTLQYDEI